MKFSKQSFPNIAFCNDFEGLKGFEYNTPTQFLKTPQNLTFKRPLRSIWSTYYGPYLTKLNSSLSKMNLCVMVTLLCLLHFFFIKLKLQIQTFLFSYFFDQTFSFFFSQMIVEFIVNFVQPTLKLILTHFRIQILIFEYVIC